VAVTTNDVLNTYLTQHLDHLLAPCQTGVLVTREVQQALYLPPAWTPAFIGRVPPQEAWARARELQTLMEPQHRALFESMMTWTRASCSKLGGASADVNQSQLFTPRRQVRMEHRFLQWANTAVRSFLPGTAFSTGAANHLPQDRKRRPEMCLWRGTGSLRRDMRPWHTTNFCATSHDGQSDCSRGGRGIIWGALVLHGL
jgi:hypothetical protein